MNQTGAVDLALHEMDVDGLWRLGHSDRAIRIDVHLLRRADAREQSEKADQRVPIAQDQLDAAEQALSRAHAEARTSGYVAVLGRIAYAGPSPTWIV